MHIVRFIAVAISVFFLVNKADAGKGHILEGRKSEFIKSFAPYVARANYKVSQQRNRLLAIREYFYRTGNLNQESAQFLLKMAKKYQVDWELDTSNFRNSALDLMNQLAIRIDVVPIRLVLAQAIIESGWGRSQAAQVTNNYFGITTLSNSGRFVTASETTTYYLKKYNSLEEGIDDYIHILNTRKSYEPFRILRAYYRSNNAELSEHRLSIGLLKFSELRHQYVAKINFVIRKYLRFEYTHYLMNS
ncbi:MAG: glucosaminidase domain-containing protein [Flavobacteriales bacterium]|nr:glucosaminidase domain-containing protein [Flavobacteriales bacterium]